MTPARLWTLTELATARAIDPASLRQRIARGTLKAQKLGRDWVVSDAEAQRVLREKGAEE